MNEVKDIFSRDVLTQITEINSWLGMYARSSKDTLRRVTKEICVFFNALNFDTIEKVENFRADDISKLYLASRENNWSNNTTNSYITTAKLFYKWANMNGVIKPNNAIFTIKRLKNDAEPKYCPSKEEMQTIMSLIKSHTNNKRLFVMVKLCIYSGLRRKEICNLKISDLMEGQIRVYGKGSKIRFQMVNQEILDEVWEYINTERKTNMDKYIQMGGKDLGYVFVSGIEDINKYTVKSKDLTNGNRVCENSFYRQIKNMCDSPKVEKGNKISPHTLRHFFGTSLYEATHDLALTQEAMRHSDLSTTRRYVHINEEKMKEALTNISI